MFVMIRDGQLIQGAESSNLMCKKFVKLGANVIGGTASSLAFLG